MCLADARIDRVIGSGRDWPKIPRGARRIGELNAQAFGIGKLGDEMSGKAMREHSEVSQMLAKILGPRQKLFAAYVASGMSYRKSAGLAGYHEDHGNRLMRKPAISARVEELRDAPDWERLLARIQARLLLVDSKLRSDLKDVRLQVKLARA